MTMITPKELMTLPAFEAVGLFAGAQPSRDDWAATYEFNCLGFNIRVNVSDEEVLNPPSLDTMYHIVGTVRMSARNGSVYLVPSVKRLISDISGVPDEVVGAGLLIRAAGKVIKRTSMSVNRQTFLKATILFGGGQKEFKSLSPEVFQKIPPENQYGRFVFGVQSASEKTVTGQTVVLQFLTLLQSQREDYAKPGSAVPPAAPVRSSAQPETAARPAAAVKT
jgi:hypothetical protein